MECIIIDVRYDERLIEMINRTIKVEYFINKETGKIGFDYAEIAKQGQKSWEVDAYELTETFTKFTNKGRVSKSDMSKYDIVNAKAEELLQKELQIESKCEDDEKVAIELAEIVTNAYINADENTEWKTIKTKTSHSDWYKFGGQLNTPSVYLTQVPAEVESQAKKLQGIRRKHQNDDGFDFEKTSYLTRKVRVADHDNGKDLM